MATFFKKLPIMKTYTCDHFKIPAKLPLMTRCDLIPAICSQLKKTTARTTAA